MSSLTETLIPAAPEVVMPERVTPLRPSEALRLGRLIHPVRIEGAYTNLLGACAVGAMFAAGFRFDERLSEQRMTCPVHQTRYRRRLHELIVHLNDRHHWSDDETVAYLEGLGL